MIMLVDQSIILLSALFWFYIDTIKIFKNEKIINSALIHSIFAASYTNVACIMYPQLIYDFSNVPDQFPTWTTYALLISYGYGYRDIYYGIETRKWDDFAHGAIYLFGCKTAYFSGNIPIAFVPFTLETSSIFLNLRPFNNIIYDLSFVITFAFYRFIVLPVFCYYYVTNPQNTQTYPIFFGCVSLTLLNMYWFKFILKKAIRLYNKTEIEYIK